MNRYSYIIKREVSYVEEVHAQIVAKNVKEATKIAEDIGNGEPFDWPAVDRYNVAEREPQITELISLEKVRG